MGILLFVALTTVAGAVVVWAAPGIAPAVLAADSVVVEVIHAYRPTAIQYLPWIAAAAVVMWVALRRSRRDAVAPNMALAAAAAAYGLWVLAVSLVHWPSDRLYAIGIPGALVVLFWALPRLVTVRTTETTFRQLLATTAAAGAILAVTAGSAALVRHIGFVVPVGHRTLLAWQWPFANKNTLGFLEAWAVPAAVALAVLSRGWARLGWWGVALVAGFGLVFSYARTGWIAAAVGVLVLAMGTWRWRGVTGVLAALAVGAAVLVKKDGIRRLTNLWAHGLSGRAGLWRASLTVGVHHWLFGVGPGNSPAALAPLVAPVFRGLTPSNAYLETLVELGVVGLVLLLVAVAVALKAAIAHAPTRPLGWAWLALLAAGLTEQLAESGFLGGLSFEDYLFTALLASVMVWQGAGMAARRRRRA